MKKNTLIKLIEKFNIVHDNKYDYSKVHYVNTHTKVEIICPSHGSFFITPNHHGRGSGCRKCYRALWTREEVAFLKNNYQLYGANYCSSKLDKNLKAVTLKAFKMGISPRKRKDTDPDVYSYEGITREYFSNVKQNAKKRGINFNIKPEDIWNCYISQDKRCALTGSQVSFSIKNDKFGTASIDRINSDKGYTIDNIQIVNKISNRLKMDMTESELFQLCKMVLDYNEIKSYEKDGVLLL